MSRILTAALAIRASFIAAAVLASTVGGSRVTAQSNNDLPADLVAWQDSMKTAGVVAAAPHSLAAPLCQGCKVVALYCSKTLNTVSDIRGRMVATGGPRNPILSEQLSAIGAQVIGYSTTPSAANDLKGGHVDCIAQMSAVTSMDGPSTLAKVEAKPGEAAEAWAATKDTTNVAVLEAFIARYKDTFFAELARARLADLKNAQTPSAGKGEKAKQLESDRPASNEGPKSPGATRLPKEEASRSNKAEASGATIQAGSVFRDCPECPEMVVVPAGRFTMGSPTTEPHRLDTEDQVAVTIGSAFAVGRFAITRGEFANFVTATGHNTEGGCRRYTGSSWKQEPGRSWRAPGFTQTDRHPVVCVTWHDAKAYAAWLSSSTGKHYRLLSEAEREYVTRAGSSTPFWWGSSASTNQANYNGGYTYAGAKGEYRKATVSVDSFGANAWGLFNVHGNVWDWTEDCWNERNAGNAGDGSARASGDCDLRVMRGGAWDYSPLDIRSASRGKYQPNSRDLYIGFRVARLLD